MKLYRPKTGNPCSCKPGTQRDNCPACESTGWEIDFQAIRARIVAYCHTCGTSSGPYHVTGVTPLNAQKASKHRSAGHDVRWEKA